MNHFLDICPRCKKYYNNPWQECDDCILTVYAET